MNPLREFENLEQLFHLKGKLGIGAVDQPFRLISLDFDRKRPMSPKRQKPTRAPKRTQAKKGFLFEQQWNHLAPIALRMESFRRVAPEFAWNAPDSRQNDLLVKILLLFTKVAPKRVTNRATHDFLNHFVPIRGNRGNPRKLRRGHQAQTAARTGSRRVLAVAEKTLGNRALSRKRARVSDSKETRSAAEIRFYPQKGQSGRPSEKHAVVGAVRCTQERALVRGLAGVAGESL